MHPKTPHAPLHPRMRSAKRLARRKAGHTFSFTFKYWVRFWIAPPGLWEVARRFVRRDRARNRVLSPPEHPTPLANLKFFWGGSEPTWIPVEKIVNRFGQSFTTEQHHMVRYLESGFHDFERFYRIHQPKTVLERSFIYETLPSAGEPNELGYPWQPGPLAETATQLRSVPEAFGPISDLELATEAARLDKVLLSIEKYGFLAEHEGQVGGQIGGWIFCKDNDDFRIVIVGGNHRTAVLAHLGWELIPVHPKAGYHPVRLSDLAQWPGVMDGRFTQKAAGKMFEALFRPRHQQLLPGW